MMQTEVLLILRNMKSNHPWYNYVQGTGTTSYINRCANEWVRMVIGGNHHDLTLFPELNDSWTVGPTQAGSNVIPYPADCLAVREVHRAEQSTLPNWNITKEFPLGYITPENFGILQKDANTVGYAKLFTRKGKSIIIHPTPSAGYTDYLRYYGWKQESALSAATDTFFMDEQWHDVVVTLAAHRIAARIGWTELAGSLLTQVEQRLEQTVNVTALQDFNGRAEVDGTPDRSTVYGS